MIPSINAIFISVLPSVTPRLTGQIPVLENKLDNFPVVTATVKPKEKPSEYRWVVDVAGLVGSIVGGLLGGGIGLVIGGAVVSAVAVPLRRWLAARGGAIEEQTQTQEILVAGAATFLFGIFFMGLAGAAKFVGGKIGTAIVKPLATRLAARAAAREAALSEPELAGLVLRRQKWQNFKQWFTKGIKPSPQSPAVTLTTRAAAIPGHHVLRAATVVPTLYDLTHDKEGHLHSDPAHWSIDTGWGFAAAIYSANGVYSKFFGINVFGLDTTAPFSIATYQLIRVIGGAKVFDLGDFNYNEAMRFRYINEFANVVQNSATLGRAYFRPDLRKAIAAEKGLTASSKTGTEKVSPFGWIVDNTLGRVYRNWVPAPLKMIIRPTVHFKTGPLIDPPKWAGRFGQKIANRLTLVEGYKENDMMKPVFGPAGRVMSLAQNWSLIVPYQMLASYLQGMSVAEWGAHRFWKFTGWPLIGNPIQAAAGGDTALAKTVGFVGVGMWMDGGITLFYNPRYKKKEWAWDLRESLAAFQNSIADKNAVAERVLNDIFCRQMTDWDLKSFVAGEGLNKFNSDYLRTFKEEAAALPLEEKVALRQVYENRLEAANKGELNFYHRKGLEELRKILTSVPL